MSHQAIHVAKYFLLLAQQEHKALSNLHIQKLVYFAHGLMLGVYGKTLIEEDIHAWQYGPVIPALYNDLKFYGKETIPCSVLEGYTPQFSQEEYKVLDKIWEVFKDYSAVQLYKASHVDGSPWQQVWRPGNLFIIIPNALTKLYYQNLVSSPVPSKEYSTAQEL